MTAEFAAIAIALYVGHHVGDYWVQTDHQAKHKGLPGAEGRWACVMHVASYIITQAVMMWIVRAVVIPNDQEPSYLGGMAGLLISGVTHYLADRREHGLMFWLARRIPGKVALLKLGVPRTGHIWNAEGDETIAPRDDNPQLATGAWALDQSWHLFFGVFVPALVMVAL
jgi:hypothetical protein